MTEKTKSLQAGSLGVMPENFSTPQQAAHTPLPWHVVEYDAGDRDHYDHNGRCPGIFPDDKHDTCIIHWDGFKQQDWSSANGDQKQIEANASFIVRACNSHYLLVEAVERLLNMPDDIDTGCNPPEMQQRVLKERLEAWQFARATLAAIKEQRT